jgi:hypothetical protein
LNTGRGSSVIIGDGPADGCATLKNYVDVYRKAGLDIDPWEGSEYALSGSLLLGPGRSFG